MSAPSWMNALAAVVVLAPVSFVAAQGTDAARADEISTTLTPEALKEIAQVEAEIDRIEAQTLERLAAPPDNQVQQIELLGKLMLHDKHLSVNRNEACAFCHTPETGFTGPVSELNQTTGSYPGSVRTRFSERKPQSHAYAPLAPWNARQSAASLLCGGSSRRTRLCRQSGGIVIRRRRRRQVSHSNPSAQPALASGCAMASPRARQSRALSGADAAQCGQAA